MQPPAAQGSAKKRQSLTLDLNSATAKRNKVQSLLTSPDVQMLKLTSPELEKFLSLNPGQATPTPTGYLFPKSVTEEQIMYAKGFEEALEQMKKAETTTAAPTENEATTVAAAASTLMTLGGAAVARHEDAKQHPMSTSTGLSLSSTSLLHVNVDSVPRPSSVASGASYDSSEGVKVKEEPDEGSLSGEEHSNGSLVSPPLRRSSKSGSAAVSPIDMNDQERIKLERKRMRNRLAASKCRKRKLEKISQLDQRVKQLKSENADLAAVVKKMKANVAMLKQEVIEHVNSGCEIRMTDVNASS